MSIALLSPKDPMSGALAERLAALGHVVIDLPGPETDLLIIGLDDDLPTVLEDHRQLLLTMPALLLADHVPSGAELVQALALGISDVILWPAADAEITTVVDRNLARRRARGTSDPELYQHVRDLERDQRAGHYIQMGMLPPNPMAIDGYRLQHRILPSLMLSGDFVDYFRITDDHFAFYIADVSGHGASSAFVTVILKNFSRRLRREYHPRMLSNPGEILVRLNREILDNNIDKHVAMFVAIVDLTTHTATYANAGHFPHAMHVASDGTRLLELTGKPIGLFADVSYNCATATLNQGDNLVLLSDGVLEVMPETGLQAKEDRLKAGAGDCAGDIDTLWQLIGVPPGTSGPDDMTCLMVTREH